ncbi:winged helix-turn-helix domain-containing protein [Rheinheimera maricola]|uniref:Winged helix DNA-binding domain-containing protein n=1 Tax=Rheinheimera maricola TaxID=2793282 RepID=A0ABS7X7E5_9GAMM|nr:crosslink repair DNA glycosylase YcaQ family protein [Rheinheimera maricola]MBZ9611090.1 winged helix DNA-binding domain-containing protein [Rheinheimera maricola]
MHNSPFNAKEWINILLQQQHLLQPAANVPVLVQQLGYVQFDSINVVERAHHHVLHSRMPEYRPALLEEAVAKGQVFEYWAHAAAYLPMADYRFSLYRKQQLKQGERHWHEPDQQMMAQVLKRLQQEGPLKASDFADSQPRQSGWWNWKPAKKALEQLFMQGDIMALRRDRLQKVFDLTERVLPPGIDTSLPDEEEYCRYLIRVYLQAQGFGTLAQMAYLRKNIKAQLKSTLQHMTERGELEQFRFQSQDYYYQAELTPPPVAAPQVWLLNPFDNLLIQRDRVKQWFNFDYQIEVYVPAAKRQYGYYSLAILWQQSLVGRVDVKADRHSKTLLLQRLSLEQVSLTDEFFAAFEHAVVAYCSFNGCTRWKLVAADDKTVRQRYRRLQYLRC